jgi:hypothetical protein
MRRNASALFINVAIAILLPSFFGDVNFRRKSRSASAYKQADLDNILINCGRRFAASSRR